jgi:exonuclease VII large subunit
MAEDQNQSKRSELRSAAPAKPGGSKTAETPSAAAEELVHAGLDQIREILFGTMYRDIERRLARANAHMVSSTHDLENQTRRRTEVLESHLRKEIGALTTRIERDLGEVRGSLDTMTRDHRDLVTRLEQRLSKVEESSAQSQRELRHQLLEQSNSFLDELQRLRKELLVTLQEELDLGEGELGEELHAAREDSKH